MVDTNHSAITSRREFQQALQDIVVEADANGVDVRGNWPVDESGSAPGWDIDIVALAGSPRGYVAEVE